MNYQAFYDDLDDEKKGWIDTLVNMSFAEWFATSKALNKRHRTDIISLVAHRRLLKKGLKYLGIGSVYKWLEPEWFERAVREGVISYVLSPVGQEYNAKTKKHDGSDVSGTWEVVAEEVDEQVEVGRRGNRPLYQTRKVLSTKRFESFNAEYQQWKKYVKEKTITPLTPADVDEFFGPQQD